MGVGGPVLTPAILFRRHIAEMREYANEVERIIGNSPIVRRIRTCADECSSALDRLERRGDEA